MFLDPTGFPSPAGGRKVEWVGPDGLSGGGFHFTLPASTRRSTPLSRRSPPLGGTGSTSARTCLFSGFLSKPQGLRFHGYPPRFLRKGNLTLVRGSSTLGLRRTWAGPSIPTPCPPLPRPSAGGTGVGNHSSPDPHISGFHSASKVPRQSCGTCRLRSLTLGSWRDP